MTFTNIVFVDRTTSYTHRFSSFARSVNNPSGTVCTPDSPRFLDSKSIATHEDKDPTKKGHEAETKMAVMHVNCLYTRHE